MTVLETERLILRPWQGRDRAPFAAMNVQPRTTLFFPHPITPTLSDASFDRIMARQQDEGMAFAVAERRSDGAFIGFVGMARLRDAGPGLDGEMEIGWRLPPEHHGQGYATEGAQAWIDHGFAVMGLPRILAWTTAANLPSQAVMARIGMTRAPELDRDHPKIEPGNPMRPHVVWSISRPLQPGRV